MSNVSLDTNEVGQSSLFVAAEGERLCKSFHSYERHAPPESFATDVHHFLFSLPQLWNLTRLFGGGKYNKREKICGLYYGAEKPLCLSFIDINSYDISPAI